MVPKCKSICQAHLYGWDGAPWVRFCTRKQFLKWQAKFSKGALRIKPAGLLGGRAAQFILFDGSLFWRCQSGKAFARQNSRKEFWVFPQSITLLSKGAAPNFCEGRSECPIIQLVVQACIVWNTQCKQSNKHICTVKMTHHECVFAWENNFRMVGQIF